MKIKIPRNGGKPILVPRKGLRKMAHDVALRLQQLNIDPITIMALFAVGDVVSLGFMTKAEYQADAKIETIRGLKVIVTQSGKQTALEHIPPKLRFDASATLAEYVYPKRCAVSHSNPDGTALAAAATVTLLLPDNGRVPLPNAAPKT